MSDFFMKAGGVLFALGLAVAAGDAKVEDKPATPAEQYQALVKDLEDAPQALSNAKNEEERKSALARMSGLPERFVALAEAHPKDPIALEALIQAVAWVNGSMKTSKISPSP